MATGNRIVNTKLNIQKAGRITYSATAGSTNVSSLSAFAVGDERRLIPSPGPMFTGAGLLVVGVASVHKTSKTT